MSSSNGAKEAESQEHNDKAKYDKQTLLLSFRIVISHKIAPFYSQYSIPEGDKITTSKYNRRVHKEE